MRLLLLSLLCTSALAAQTAQEIGLVDVIYRRGASDITGQIVRYEYGKQVDIATTAGDTLSLKWNEFHRVNFRYDRELLQAAKDAERVKAKTLQADEAVGPAYRLRRKWRHHLSAGTLLGTQNLTDRFNFEPNRARILGIGLSYHFVLPYDNLAFGGGLDYALFSYSREETTLAVTGLVEYAFLNQDRKFSPYIRLVGGPALPIAPPNADNEIDDRNLGLMYTPSIGGVFRPSSSNATELYFDIGYLFLNSRFQLTTPTLDVLERRVAYRRVSLRGGIRF